MAHRAADNHRPALEHRHAQSASVRPPPIKSRRHRLAQHAGRLADRHELVARRPIDDDVAKDTHRALPRDWRLRNADATADLSSRHLAGSHRAVALLTARLR